MSQNPPVTSNDLSGVAGCDGRLFDLLARIEHLVGCRGGWLRPVGLGPPVLDALDQAELPDVLLMYRGRSWRWLSPRRRRGTDRGVRSWGPRRCTRPYRRGGAVPERSAASRWISMTELLATWFTSLIALPLTPRRDGGPDDRVTGIEVRAGACVGRRGGQACTVGCGAGEGCDGDGTGR